MNRLIIGGIMRLIGLTVGKSPRTTPRGIESKMGWLLAILPFIGVSIVLAFGFAALKHPDPVERTSCAVGFVLAAVFLAASVYFLTFRLTLEGGILRTSSAITRDRTIDLTTPFSTEFVDADRTLHVRQGKEKISVNWMMSGHVEFFLKVESYSDELEDEDDWTLESVPAPRSP